MGFWKDIFGKNDDLEPDWEPKEEGHHSDGSGKGPPDVWIIRHGHEMIHDDVGYYAQQIEGREKRYRGFYGDPTTLKLGNKYFNSYGEDHDDDFNSYDPPVTKSKMPGLIIENLIPDIFDKDDDFNSYDPPVTKSKMPGLIIENLIPDIFDKDDDFNSYDPPVTKSKMPGLIIENLIPDIFDKDDDFNSYDPPVTQPTIQSINYEANQKHWMGGNMSFGNKDSNLSSLLDTSRRLIDTEEYKWIRNQPDPYNNNLGEIIYNNQLKAEREKIDYSGYGLENKLMKESMRKAESIMGKIDSSGKISFPSLKLESKSYFDNNAYFNSDGSPKSW